MTGLTPPAADSPATRPTVRPARPDESGVIGELAFRSKAHWG